MLMLANQNGNVLHPLFRRLVQIKEGVEQQKIRLRRMLNENYVKLPSCIPTFTAFFLSYRKLLVKKAIALNIYFSGTKFAITIYLCEPNLQQ